MTLEKTCFFCGHIFPVFYQTTPFHGKLEEQLTEEVEGAYQRGYRYFFSSGNYGFDMMGAKTVADFRDTGHPDVELHLVAYDDGRRQNWGDLEKRGFASIYTRADSVDYPWIFGVPANSLQRCNSMVMRSSMGIFYYDFYVNDHVSSIYTYFRLTAQEGMRLVNMWESFPEDETFGPRR